MRHMIQDSQLPDCPLTDPGVQNSRTGFLRIIRLGASAFKRPFPVVSGISFP